MGKTTKMKKEMGKEKGQRNRETLTNRKKEIMKSLQE
jgi:hypothetical protein